MVDRHSLAYRVLQEFGPYVPGETFPAESLHEAYTDRLLTDGVIEEVHDEAAAEPEPVAPVFEHREEFTEPYQPRPALVLDPPAEEAVNAE